MVVIIKRVNGTTVKKLFKVEDVVKEYAGALTSSHKRSLFFMETVVLWVGGNTIELEPLEVEK